jgi:prepilin-type N-terminal cleavage/methylation domain-containing protein
MRVTPKRDPRGFTMIEVMIAVAAIVMLSAMLAPVGLSWLDEGRAARAQNDAAAIGTAMMRFFQDTSKWPGQVEILQPSSTVRFLTVGTAGAGAFPTVVGSVGIGSATCAGGLTGVVGGTTSFAGAAPSSANSLDVLDYLVSPPSSTNYPNWRGPYLPIDLTADPWGRVYVINVIPMFCDESVTAAAPGGVLGYGWVMSAGPNGTLQTLFTASRLAAGADDVGAPFGKRAVYSGS